MGAFDTAAWNDEEYQHDEATRLSTVTDPTRFAAMAERMFGGDRNKA